MTEPKTPHIGTADWRHAHWRTRFYPPQLPAHAWLDHYSRHLNTVELDGARLAGLDAGLAASWCGRLPSQFTFTVQAPRLLTHVHKLRNCGHLVETLFERLRPLEHRLGPILFSLPPKWHCNPERLDAFLSALPPPFRYAVEFQDRDWLRPETLALLRERGAALCLSDRLPEDVLDTVTADFIYARLYGPSRGGRYTAVGLRAWASRLAGWRRRRLDGYVLFQNDALAYAVKNACLLRDFGGLQATR